MKTSCMDFTRPRSVNANNLLTSIRSNVLKNPDTTALVCNNLKRTWKEVWERTNQLGSSLLDLGLHRGDRVAMVLKNSIEFSELFIATAKAGLIKVPMNYNLKEFELAYQLNDCEASLLFVHLEFLERVLKAAKKVPTLHTLIVVGDDAPGSMVSYEDLVAKGSLADMDIEISPNDIEILLYTSGTTGRPKGVVRGFAENYNVGMSYCVEAGITSESVLLTVPPQYHVGPCGTFWATLVAGGTQVILEKFDPETVLQAMEKHRATWTMMVPTMYNLILALPGKTLAGYDLSSVETLICGGSSLFTPTKVKIRELFANARLNECYGSTELAMSTILHDRDQMLKERSVGKPWQDMEIRLINGHGREVEQGEIGILYARGPGLFRGYWKNETGTREAFIDSEWATVGDLARQDSEGYYYIVDRVSDMIISGGVNVYPAEIEAVIYDMEGILEAAVVGVPDEHWGEAVKALIVLTKGVQMSEPQVIAFCKERLASFKAPKSVDFVEMLPKTASGKIMKSEIKNSFWK